MRKAHNSKAFVFSIRICMISLFKGVGFKVCVTILYLSFNINHHRVTMLQSARDITMFRDCCLFFLLISKREHSHSIMFRNINHQKNKMHLIIKKYN